MAEANDKSQSTLNRQTLEIREVARDYSIMHEISMWGITTTGHHAIRLRGRGLIPAEIQCFQMKAIHSIFYFIKYSKLLFC